MLFDRLQSLLANKRVADVFAGTGTLGFEALSRGARSVVFFEQDRRAQELLRQNVESLGVAPVTLCWRVDVLRTSFKPKGREPWYPYDVVFYDPPYAMAETIQPGTPLYKSLERLGRDDVTAAEALLVLRVAEQTAFQLPPGWALWQQIDISSMEMHVFRKQA
jgi:16S rRNA (guanine966-N2)-methyltransferase